MSKNYNFFYFPLVMSNDINNWRGGGSRIHELSIMIGLGFGYKISGSPLKLNYVMMMQDALMDSFIYLSSHAYFTSNHIFY